MAPKIKLLQLFLLLFLFIGFFKKLPPIAYAQNAAVSPTFNCLGPCSNSSSSSSSTSPSPSTTLTQISSAPVSVPTSSTPCQTVATHAKKDAHHHQGGFLESIFQLFQLLLQILEQAGGNVPVQPMPCPQPVLSPPSPSPAPTIPSSTSSSASTSASTAGRAYPWHTNIVSTTFWVGELFNASLADGSQVCSTYDSSWAFHWSGVNNGTVPADAAGCAGAIIGGCDGIAGANNACATEKRTAANGYFPSKITPKENPFYLDVPFDDLNDTTAFGQRCQVIPWANDPGYSGHCTDTNFSYMKNKFVRIVGANGNTCYGQIEDAGPSEGSNYHDVNYVFGTNDARPAQTQFNNAGADVSPALNGCLGFAELDGQNDKIKWQFVDTNAVPDGPWKKVITTSGVTR